MGFSSLPRRVAPLTIGLVLGATQVAFSATTGSGIAGVDTAGALLIKVVQVVAAIAAVVLLGTLIWDYAIHRNLFRAFFELLGIAFLGYISSNPQTLTAALGLTGAHL